MSRIVRRLAAGYLALGAVLYFALHVAQYPGPLHRCNVSGAEPFEFVAAASDGRTLSGLSLRVPLDAPGCSRAPVVFFGGNPEHISGVAAQAQDMLLPLVEADRALCFRVYVSAYRGYAPNDGWTSQAALTSDAIDLVHHALRNSTDVGRSIIIGGARAIVGRVIVVGTSMGAGVSLQLAAARPAKVAGLLLNAPFSSMWAETLAFCPPLTYLLLPWIWLSDHWDSVGAMAALPPSVPVAVLSPLHDRIIPPAQHQEVFQACDAHQRWWLPAPGLGHNSLGGIVGAGLDGLLRWARLTHRRSSLEAAEPEGRGSAGSLGGAVTCHTEKWWKVWM